MVLFFVYRIVSNYLHLRLFTNIFLLIQFQLGFDCDSIQIGIGIPNEIGILINGVDNSEVESRSFQSKQM